MSTRLSIVIVRHALERWRASNTARLAALALPDCTILDYAARGRPFDDAVLDEEGAWLLYPEGEPRAPARPPGRLVVLDGTWQQTRRMRQRIPALTRLPASRILCLPAPPPRPRLRRPTRPEGMSTLEAIARAVALFDGEAAAAPLETLLEAAVAAHRALQSRSA